MCVAPIMVVPFWGTPVFLISKSVKSTNLSEFWNSGNMWMKKKSIVITDHVPGCKYVQCCYTHENNKII